MKVIFFILFLLITQYSFSQDTTYYSSDWKESDRSGAEFYRVLTKQDSLWKIEDYYINNRLQMTGYLNEPVNTARHGDFKWFNETGNVFQTGRYVNGKKDGELVFYFDNGQIENVENYKNGIFHGPFSGYYENGQMKVEGKYVDGNLDGIIKYWYSNGQLKSYHEFDNGKRVGKRQYYDLAGNIVEEYLYENKYEIIKNRLVFEIPNEEWFRNKLAVNQRFTWHSFKRNPIRNSDGIDVYPNISFLIEDVQGVTDVILFSAQKRETMPFQVDSVFTYEGSNLRLKNAVGYLGKTKYDDGTEHTVLVVHALLDKKGIQIVMDITSDLFDEYGKEFWSALDGIYEPE